MSAGRKTVVLPPAVRPASPHEGSPALFAQCVSRAQAISTYRPSRSMPKNCRSSSTAAIPVVPLPVNGSSTIPPGGVTSFTSQRMSAMGFTVGCRLRTTRGGVACRYRVRTDRGRQLLASGLALEPCGLGAEEQTARGPVRSGRVDQRQRTRPCTQAASEQVGACGEREVCGPDSVVSQPDPAVSMFSAPVPPPRGCVRSFPQVAHVPRGLAHMPV